jgi:arylsulfatase A-like enzyme
LLNCIVVMFDTLRYDAVFGDEVDTPNLRGFAGQSVVFSSAWGEGEPTVPVRRSCMTGMRSYPWRHHIGDRGSFPNILGWHMIPEDQTTLSEYLYQRGYATGLVTDVWHLFKSSMNFVRGFVSWDFVRGQEGDTFRLMPDSAVDGRQYVPERLAGNPGPTQYLMSVIDRERDEDYFAAQVFSKAAQWVELNQDNGPFFLWVDSFSPHEFWDPPRRYADRYFTRPGVRDYIVPQMLNQTDATPEEIARTQALYRGYVTFCDEWFGRFMDRLQSLGLLKDTVVIVTSDHGTELWDKGHFGKNQSRLHPFNTQLNLMIHHPDLSRGHGIDAFVQHHDIVPTVLDMLGVGYPQLDGESLLPLISGERKEIRDYVITGWGPYACVRDREWNLIIDTTDLRQPPQLYNVVRDRAENYDVAAEHPEVVQRQIARLEALLGAPLPARYVHRPATGFAATVNGLRQIRTRLGIVPGRAGDMEPGSRAPGRPGSKMATGAKVEEKQQGSNWPFEGPAAGL